MGFTVEKPHQREVHPTAKKRVWGFFGDAAQTSRGKPAAAQLPHRAERPSPTKPASGVIYYGYRHYDPVTGRWPSRDPIGERGGINLYGMVGNDALNNSDYLGLRKLTEKERRMLNKMGIGGNNSLIVFGQCCEDEDMEELGRRMSAAAESIKKAIEAVPEGEDDPAGLRMQIEALMRMYWPNKNQKDAYKEGAKGRYYKCSDFVRAVIQAALGQKFKAQPNAGGFVNGNDEHFERDYGIVLPPRTKDKEKVEDVVQPGDIIAGGEEGRNGADEAHVVISLPNGLVIGHHPDPAGQSKEVRVPGHNVTIRPLERIIKKPKVVVRVPK